jgi:hypothetical protein
MLSTTICSYIQKCSSKRIGVIKITTAEPGNSSGTNLLFYIALAHTHKFIFKKKSTKGCVESYSNLFSTSPIRSTSFVIDLQNFYVS